MEFDKKVIMSVEDWQKFENDEDYEFAYGTVDFLSNRPNSHKHYYSEEVIKQYADTVINKWVIAEYDNLTQDATTHTINQKIVGRVPEQKVKFRYDEDGYLVASVDIILSKLYATDIYNMFRQGVNKRAVSIEELVGFTPETEEYIDGTVQKDIVGFNITGITILGLAFKPSIPNANIQLTQMSEEMIEKAEKEYAKYSQNHQFSMIMDKLDIIENKLTKEETMAKIEEDAVVLEEVQDQAEVTMAEVQNSEQAIDQEQETDILQQVEVNAETEDDDKSEKDEESDTDDKEEEVVENATETEVVQSSCDEEKYAELEVQMAELQSKLDEAEVKITQYEAELSTLREYKITVENQQKDNIVSTTLSQIKNYVSDAEYADFEAQGTKCEYSEITNWKNEVLASIADRLMTRMTQIASQEEGITDIGMPVSQQDTQKSIYD